MIEPVRHDGDASEVRWDMRPLLPPPRAIAKRRTVTLLAGVVIGTAVLYLVHPGFKHGVLVLQPAFSVAWLLCAVAALLLGSNRVSAQRAWRRYEAEVQRRRSP